MSSHVGEGVWPALPLEEWRDTKDTLHRYCQVIGKVRLALAPFANHWWHVTLHVTVDDELLAALERLDVEVDVDMTPYDGGAVARFAQISRSSTVVLEEFAGRFNGKQSPVQLFWHSFDLAHARFSGRRAPVRAGPAILPYNAVRTTTNPRTTLVGFREDAYRAGARTAGWDLHDLATRAAP